MIALYGGSFAPLHNGHLRFAIEALEGLRLERVHLVTSARPPHRDTPSVDGWRRHAWVERVVAQVPGLVADDDELLHEGPSYSVDTLQRARSRFSGQQILWLVGTDAFNKLHHWHDWPRLFAMAHIVVAARPGHPLSPHPDVAAYPQISANQLRETDHGGWHSLPIPEMDVSSTSVRERIARGASLRGLVPDALLDTLTTRDLDDLAAAHATQ